MVRLEALMMGSRSVEMAAEVEKVRWRRRIGSGEEGLPNKNKDEHIIFDTLGVSKSIIKENVQRLRRRLDVSERFLDY
jgi:hypothetical protein